MSQEPNAEKRNARKHGARKMTTHQKAVLIQVLRTFSDERVEICYAPDADDALSYAEDFLSIFKAIGWDVSGPDPKPCDAMNPSSGIALLAQGGKLPACAEALRDALRICEIELTAQAHATAAADACTFTLWVGPS